MSGDVRRATASTYHTEPEFIQVRDVRVAYRRAGAGPPTVFLHGAGTTRLWLPFYQRMSRSVDFLAPEHPGFGDTEAPAWLEGMDDVVWHYRAVLDAFGLDRVHLVGFSLGGWIAAELAVFYPERLRSLTLIAPAGLRVPGTPITDLFRVPPERVPALLFNDREAEYADYLPAPGDVEDALRGYTEMSMFARLTWNPRYDRKLDHRLADVTAPALVLAAADDRIVPRAHPERWAELLPGARLEIVGGAGPTGHLAIVQEPGRVAELITGFIEECEK